MSLSDTISNILYTIKKYVYDKTSADAKFVKYTDIPTTQQAGPVKAGNWLSIDDGSTNANDKGKMKCGELTLAQYQTCKGYTFISKTTLENALSGKGYLTSASLEGYAKKTEASIEYETEIAEINVASGCSNLPLRKLVVEGRSEQAQYSGKNLWDGVKTMSSTRASLIREINSISGLGTDLRVKSSSTATYACVQRRIDGDLKTGVQYTVSFDVEIITKGNIRVSRRKSGNSVITTTTCSTDGHYKLTFTKSADDYYLTFFVTYSTAGEGEAIFRNIQIEEGGIDTDYEPYCGSYYDSENDVNVILPSPNPDYLQPIKSVGDSGELIEHVDNALQNPTDTQLASIPLTEPLRSSADGMLKDILVINADGSGTITRYIGKQTTNDITYAWTEASTVSIFYVQVNNCAKKNYEKAIKMFCDLYIPSYTSNSVQLDRSFKFSNPGNADNGYFYIKDTRFSTREDLMNYLKDNPITFTYELRIPTTEQLTPAQTQAFLQLHSNELTTVAYNSDNAKQSITYVTQNGADTKNYIQNEIVEGINSGDINLNRFYTKSEIDVMLVDGDEVGY